MNDDIRLGATGRFPEGEFPQGNEGELRAAIGTTKGQVVIDFGKPVSWVALPPAAARELGLLLLRRACAIDGGPLVLDLGVRTAPRPEEGD